MPKDLIPLEVVGGEPRVDSRIISERLGAEHRFTVRLIKKYENEFKELGLLRFQNAKAKGGRPEKFTLLSEAQSIFLLTLSKNSEQVISLKLNLTKAFEKYKKAYLRQAANQGKLAWQAARNDGKLIRREETDMIKDFADYATKQGSKNSQRYYVLFSKLVNKNLFLGYLEIALHKPKDFRGMLDKFQIMQLAAADILVAKTIKKGMEDGLHYKIIYQLAKEKVEAFAKVIGMTPVLPEEPKDLQLTD